MSPQPRHGANEGAIEQPPDSPASSGTTRTDRGSIEGISTILIVLGVLTMIIGVVVGIYIGATVGTADADGVSTGQHPDAGLGVGLAIGSLAYGLLLVVVGRIGQTVAVIDAKIRDLSRR